MKPKVPEAALAVELDAREVLYLDVQPDYKAATFPRHPDDLIDQEAGHAPMLEPGRDAQPVHN